MNGTQPVRKVPVPSTTEEAYYDFGSVVADFSFPIRAHLAQVIGENVSRAAAVRAMADDDVLVRQSRAAVHPGEPRVVPLRNFAEVNIGQGRTVEFQGRAARKIVGDRDRAGHGGDVEQFTRRLG